MAATWLDRIFAHFRYVEHMQRAQINVAHMDRSLMLANIDRVTNWSSFQMFIMLAVSLLQIFVIRSLFDQRSLLYRLWLGKGIRVSTAPLTNARC
ncbi:unnamed protein product [Protopolystoma xenopodis]|uniref:GOLD domain-containing protein n=1 Tax=Protopolystoma xenopodis TaxID=117903 RepID=A0A3S5AH74_9PLAT|nr:unnamed protein product [Protopolystoma xenopodis]